MAATIHLEIVTPERKVASVETSEVIAPGGSGLFGVRPGHAPFLTVIQPGELSFREGDVLRRFAVGGGFIEVENDRVRVLADTAESAEEIDAERARRASEDAQKRLKGLPDTDPEFELQQARLRRAAVRIHTAGKH